MYKKSGRIIHSKLLLVCALLYLSCEFKGERKDKSKRAQMWAKESAGLKENITHRLTYSPHHLVELFTKYPKMLTWGLPSQQLHIFDVRSLTRPNLIWVHFYPVNLKTYLLTVSLPERLDMRVRGQNRSFWACPVHLWCLQNRSGPPMAPNGQLAILSFLEP